MSYCKNCGKEIIDGATFCSNCGAPTGNGSPQIQSQKQQSDQQTYQYYEQAKQFTDKSEAADVQKNKAMGIIAYIGILVLIPIFAAKDSKFAHFHASQGLNLFILELANSILKLVLGQILPYSIWSAFSWVFSIISLTTFVFSIIGIVFACKGEKKELPLIGSFDILEKIKSSKVK